MAQPLKKKVSKFFKLRISDFSQQISLNEPHNAILTNTNITKVYKHSQKQDLLKKWRFLLTIR